MPAGPDAKRDALTPSEAPEPPLVSIYEDIAMSQFCPSYVPAQPITHGLRPTTVPKDGPSLKPRPTAFHVPQPVPSPDLAVLSHKAHLMWR